MNIHNRFGHPDPDDPEVEIEAIERRITDATKIIDRRQARLARYGQAPIPRPPRAASWIVAVLGILVVVAIIFLSDPAPMPVAW